MLTVGQTQINSFVCHIVDYYIPYPSPKTQEFISFGDLSNLFFAISHFFFHFGDLSKSFPYLCNVILMH